jgi:hypothetical protein
VRLALLVAALALLAGGCGAADDEPPAAAPEPRLVSFDEAREADDGTVVELGGAVYADDEPMRVCRELAESFPPQCGAGIPVVGVTWGELPRVQRASGVTWTDAGVILAGEMRGGTLHVRRVSPWHTLPQSAEPAPTNPGSNPDEPVSSDD